MDFIDEQQRALPRPPSLTGRIEDFLEIGDARKYRRQLLEVQPAAFDSSRAMVVLPVPGGPRRMIECGRFSATMRPMGPVGASR